MGAEVVGGGGVVEEWGKVVGGARERSHALAVRVRQEYGEEVMAAMILYIYLELMRATCCYFISLEFSY